MSHIHRISTRAALASLAAAAMLAVTLGAPAANASPASGLANDSPRMYKVARVVDGDTIVLSTGARVRIIGIDTPEHGKCGFDPSKKALVALIEGKSVVLGNPSSVKDTDAYGRWLRTVKINGVDIGLRQIRSGWANARYDSVDGYQWHPGQKYYRAADAATKHRCGLAVDKVGTR